jgi:hypothetical protein
MTNLNVTATPTPTNKLDTKLSEWIFQMKSQNSDYFAIVLDGKGKMYYMLGKSDQELNSFDMLIDTGNGFERALSYRKEDTSSSVLPTPFLIIVKKEKKLIVNHRGEIFGFGFKDNIDSKVKRLLIHFCTNSTHMLITATEKAAFIDVTYSWVENSNTDPLKDCLHALFCSVDCAQKEVR